MSQLIVSHNIQLDRVASVAEVIFPELFKPVQPLLAEVHLPHLALVSLRDAPLSLFVLLWIPSTSYSVTKSKLGEHFLYQVSSV